MTARHSWSGSSRSRLTVMFLVVVLPPALTLIWLGLRLLEQDQILEAQREIEGREAAAEAIVRSLAQSVAELANQPVTQLPEGVLRVVIASSGVRSDPAARMLWTEKVPELLEAATVPFLDAEKAEFQGGLESALRNYRELSRSSEESVRAGALVRAARVERNQQQIDAALLDYRNLAEIRVIAINGMPADLLARRAIAGLLKDSGRAPEFRQHVDALAADLIAHRWTLDRASWEITAGDIEQWTERPLPISADDKALTLAAEWLWQSARNGGLPASGRRNLVMEPIPVTLVWRTETPLSQPSQWETTIVTRRVVESALEKAVQGASKKAGRVSLLTDSGELFSGRAPDLSAGVVRRTSPDTSLPLTVVLSATNESREAASLDSRRRLVGSGLAAIILLLAGGSYFLWRVIAQELAVARLQTDFVAAVSHEFRTPLTSLRHITELLQEDDGAPGPEQEQRKTFYAALDRNTERLHRLVESLLDFSRMESGKKPWRREAMDAGVLAAKVVADFEKEVEARGVRIDLVVDNPEALLLKADADALGHALWNLLDNAVKYSPGRQLVHVGVERSSHGIVIAVSDEGLGIPAREQRQIFDKFVRGQKAGELGIKGTGLGLAIVSHIVAAHGGAVEVESEEGRGSTFRMVLPSSN
jgi:signal transduction histidine kinase